jgi:hypothetical protein
MGEDPTTYSDVRASAYAEVGLPLDLQLTGYAPYVVAWNAAPGERMVSLGGGDAEVGLTRSLSHAIPLAAEVRTRFPTYVDRTAERQDRFGAFAGGFPVVGDGSIGVEGWLHAGGGFGLGSTRGWVQGAAGYRYRLGDTVDAWVFDAVAGLTPGGGWVGLGLGGAVNVGPDERAQDGIAARVFGALPLSEVLRVEANTSFTPMAHGRSPGLGAGVGLSVQR